MEHKEAFTVISSAAFVAWGSPWRERCIGSSRYLSADLVHVESSREVLAEPTAEGTFATVRREVVAAARDAVRVARLRRRQ